MHQRQGGILPRWRKVYAKAILYLFHPPQTQYKISSAYEEMLQNKNKVLDITFIYRNICFNTVS